MQAKDIVLLACQIAKGPGMTFIGGQMLNLVLEDLKLNRDLKINRVTQMITVTTGTYGPFALEADYLRTYDLFYPIPPSGGGTAGGITQFLSAITMEQWDAEFKDPSDTSYPWEFATDLSTDAQVWSGGSQGVGTLTSAGALYIYPQTSGQIVMTHRYMKNQPDMVGPATSTVTPWFSYTDYLINATAARICKVTGDDRYQQLQQEAENQLRPHLIMQGDEQEAIHQIKLDPRHFHGPRGLKPTKSYPF
jgi:hypothetical protein